MSTSAAPPKDDSASGAGPAALPADDAPPPHTTPPHANNNNNKNNSDTYALGRDMKAASRLGHQHYLWHETLGFHLHPATAKALHLDVPPSGPASSPPPLLPLSTPSSAPPPHAPQATPHPGSDHLPSPSGSTGSKIQIADVACGATSWLRSVALAFPDRAELQGYDISLAQCPPTAWLPRNITSLREWNLYSPPTEEMVGKYDVVHTRLIFTVVEGATDDEGVAKAREVVSSLMRLVKPGGWLQWDELDVERSFILQARNETDERDGRDGAADGRAGDDAGEEDRRRGGEGTRDNEAGAGPRPPLLGALGQGSGQQAPGAGGGAAAAACAPTMARFLSILRQKGKWVAQVPDLMREAGLEDVNLWRYDEREDLAMQFFENNLLKDEEMANGGLRGTEQGKRLADMVQKMWEESRAGIVVCTPKVVITARRSSVA